MRVRIIAWLMAVFGVGCAGCVRADGLPGRWIGAVELDGNRWVRIDGRFEASDGGLVGALDIVATGTAGLPLSDLVVDGPQLAFRLKALGRDIRFHGRIDGDEIQGTARGASGWTGSFGFVRAHALDENGSRDFVGAYELAGGSFAYLQRWDELGANQLVAFEETGLVRGLYPVGPDRFVTGSSVGFPVPIEAHVTFHRGEGGVVESMTWQRVGEQGRRATRVQPYRDFEVHFGNDTRLAGTLSIPSARGKHPAIVLVHGSGPADRNQVLPFARFLARRGVALLAYDKRGVGESEGDWKLSSMEDLARDAIAAVNFLRARDDIDDARVGVLGVSQGGWVAPLAATLSTNVAFVVSVSGAGVTPAETTLDYTRNEMRAGGAPPDLISEVVAVTELAFDYARSGDGWERYSRARAGLGGKVPLGESTPAAPDDPYWDFARRLFFYDPVPTLRQLDVPTLAIWGALDNNVLPEKNEAAWKTALAESGNSDISLVVLANANHLMMQAVVGSTAEIPSLQGFAPDYFSTLLDWLSSRVGRIDASRQRGE